MKLQILQLTIVSPEGILYEGQVKQVTFPGTLGSFTVFPEHAPLISSLNKGVIQYLEEEELEELEIDSGFVEIRNDHIAVCVEQ